MGRSPIKCAAIELVKPINHAYKSAPYERNPRRRRGALMVMPDFIAVAIQFSVFAILVLPDLSFGRGGQAGHVRVNALLAETYKLAN
jgi:hypothetical protein